VKAADKLDQIHLRWRQNKWINYFALFNRLILAVGFIPAGITKITGERFASGLSILHPMGSYLEALHHTGYYYTSIGIAQVVAGVLLLIPRTVTLGAIIYFPIILNICILSFAVRFDGSLLTSPLMVLSNLFLLFWNYDRIKFILPIKSTSNFNGFEKSQAKNKSFPIRFFVGVALTTFLTIGIVISINVFYIMPRNHIKDCKLQFKDSNNREYGYTFCECIHEKGNSLDECLKEYEKATSH
jgi:uncharacterized membrane protein YphA (DoxX/SURF4 family)